MAKETRNKKTTRRMEENICKWSDQEGINVQIYKQLMQLNKKKKKNSNHNLVQK